MLHIHKRNNKNQATISIGAEKAIDKNSKYIMKLQNTRNREKSSQVSREKVFTHMKVKVDQSCLTLCHPWTIQSWNSPGQNTGVGSLSLLQGIFPTWGSNPGLSHCRWILYQLSHQGCPNSRTNFISWPQHRKLEDNKEVYSKFTKDNFPINVRKTT